HALESLLARANNPRDAAAAGVDFVMLLGYLAGGWQMARAAAAASKAEADHVGNPDFMKAKQASASAYIAYSLPEVGKLASKMMAGPDALAKMDASWL
ncbi:MAG: acyl-CoA dehydrogenase C-terminal domain-containing protein, partial [Candidatus Puniceispirillum sp.]